VASDPNAASADACATADTGSPEGGTFTLSLNMSSATAQVFGIIIVAPALTLAATKVVHRCQKVRLR